MAENSTISSNTEKVAQFFVSLYNITAVQGLCQNKGVEIPESLRRQLVEQAETLLIEDEAGRCGAPEVNDSLMSKNVRACLDLNLI